MTAEEDPAHRLKRLKMRSWRRGTKEMDLILGPFADQRVPELADRMIEAYDRLLAENDQDLYPWFTEREEAPEEHREILGLIRDFHRDLTKSAKNTAN